MFATVTHMLPKTSFRRARTLPVHGSVLVRAGQTVQAIDVIAEGVLPGRHLLIDVRKVLSLRDAAAAHKALERKAGEKLQKGDVIAQTGGMFSRVIRAPEACEIISIQNGQVLLGTLGEPVELKAAFPGRVVEIIPEFGAVIETSGTLVQGVWGNNLTATSLLEVVAHSPDAPLTRADLDITLRGSIILAGHLSDPEVFDAAAELPLRGMILGSMTAELIPAAMKQPYPIALLEGFGKLPINTVAYRLLADRKKDDVVLNATWDPLMSQRPDILLPFPVEAELATDWVEYAPGQTVKVLRPPYASQVGLLVAIKPGLTSFPGGLRVPAGEVRLETNETVTVPLNNLTILD